MDATNAATKTTKSAPEYILGTVGGFLFTGLPTFRSGFEACEYARANPMQGVVLVYERRELSRLGVNYGCELEVVATART